MKTILILISLVCWVGAVPTLNRDVAIQAKEVEEIGGFVLFRYNETTKTFEYLLVEKAKEPGDWSPCKGHVEKGEIPVDAAYREMREETTLLAEHYQVHYGIHEYFEYETNDDVVKHVTLWPARLTALDHPIILSEESRDYKWVGDDECLKIIKAQYKQSFVNIIQQLHSLYNSCVV